MANAKMAMLAAAGQAAVGIGGTPTDLLGGIVSTLFAGLWLLAAALFP